MSGIQKHDPNVPAIVVNMRVRLHELKIQKKPGKGEKSISD
jgi:hypothetical protein